MRSDFSLKTQSEQDRPRQTETYGRLTGTVPGISISSLHFGQMSSPITYCTSNTYCVLPLACCVQYHQEFPASHRLHTVFKIFTPSSLACRTSEAPCVTSGGRRKGKEDHVKEE